MQRVILVLAFGALSSSSAAAFSAFRAEVPNGNTASCLTCHDRAGGGRPWNPFGDELFLANGGVVDTSSSIDAFDDAFIWWNAAICNADSDGDGQTNGQELGDPECIWTGGAAARTTDISAPGNPDSTSADPDGTGGGAAAEGEGEGGGGGDGGGGAGGCCGSPPALALSLSGLLLRRRRT